MKIVNNQWMTDDGQRVRFNHWLVFYCYFMRPPQYRGHAVTRINSRDVQMITLHHRRVIDNFIDRLPNLPIGNGRLVTVAAVGDRIGIAICHPKDEYSKKEGRIVAMENLYKESMFSGIPETCDECGEPIDRAGYTLFCANGCFEDDVRHYLKGDNWR